MEKQIQTSRSRYNSLVHSPKNKGGFPIGCRLISFTCAGLKPFELREKETAFNFSVLIRIGSVYCIRLYGLCIFITDCTFIRFSRISCADECTEVLQRMVFLKDCRNDRS